MKPETDPVTPDEWLIRLVWGHRVTDRVPIIAPEAFEPRKNEDGISLFRLECLNDPIDTLLVIAEEKRSKYAIVKIPISLISELKLKVKPDPIQTVPGHVVLPEMNFIDCKANKPYFKAIYARLAEVASENIIRRPSASESAT